MLCFQFPDQPVKNIPTQKLKEQMFCVTQGYEIINSTSYYIPD